MCRKAALAAALLSLAAAPVHAAIVEDVVEVPVSVRTIYNQEVAHRITVTIWRDDERTKAPFLVMNHGRPANAAAFATMGRVRYSENSRYFVSKGFVVAVPTRIGYGVTAGSDVEYTGPCHGKNYAPAFNAAAEQALAVITHLKSLPYIDGSKGLVVGQSFGGAAAVALATRSHNSGVLAAINFSGGSGGDPQNSPERPCRADLLERVFADYGKAARIPMLWLYSENDRYWGKELPKRWFHAFAGAGGNARFVQMPAFKHDGHPSFTANADAWRGAVEAFLREVGF
jgi:dienelactone hydrolase